jgi:hypothetical protein
MISGHLANSPPATAELAPARGWIMIEKHTRTFTLNEAEYAEVKRWRNTHDCTPPEPGKLFSGDGAVFTYSFTPGGMGDHVSVTCGWCGQTHTVTDSDNW